MRGLSYSRNLVRLKTGGLEEARLQQQLEKEVVAEHLLDVLRGSRLEVQEFFDLLFQDRQLNVYAGQRQVRPPAAPTSEPSDGRATGRVGSVIVWGHHPTLPCWLSSLRLFVVPSLLALRDGSCVDERVGQDRSSREST
jgi:hypothetical protein